MAEKKSTAGNSLHGLFTDAIMQGFSCVAYRLPQKQQVFFRAGNLSKVTNSLPAEADFLISGFNVQQGIYTIGKKYFRQAVDIHPENTFIFPQLKLKLPQSTPKSHYTKIVAQAVKDIEGGKLQKVVLSRIQKIPLPQHFDAVSFFGRLTHSYPDAFVYLLASPVLGYWIGATPELLLKKHSGNILETIALAGTRHISEAGKIPSAGTIFEHKEKHEQNVVAQYIEQVLKPFAEEMKLSGADIKQAGKLYHLQTNITATLQAQFTNSSLQVLQELHPTPAVAGIPLAQAQAFIQQYEDYDRSLYTGFLGPVEINGDMNLFVNLRSMQFNGSEAVLYAGAGIVNGSDPEKEWQETEHKMRTLLDAM